MWKAPGSPQLILKLHVSLKSGHQPTSFSFTSFNKTPHESARPVWSQCQLFKAKLFSRSRVWGKSRREAQLLQAMTNPRGLLCMTTPLCSSLPNIFMCSSAPESPQRILLPSSYLAYTGRPTVKCNWLLLERQMLSKLLHQFTKEAVEKTNQAFGCQEIQASFYPGVAGVALSREDDKCGYQVSAALCFLLTFLPSSNGCGKESLKKGNFCKDFASLHL